MAKQIFVDGLTGHRPGPSRRRSSLARPAVLDFQDHAQPLHGRCATHQHSHQQQPQLRAMYDGIHESPPSGCDSRGAPLEKRRFAYR
jgi:hypothetical protein